MPSPEFVEAVIATVDRIPAGRVMTYGDVAIALGSNAPRAVGRVLALHGHAMPWWRVVPASGQPPRGHAREALPHYLEEGTPLRHGDGRRSRSELEPGGAEDYRIALSSARLPYTHEIFGDVAL